MDYCRLNRLFTTQLNGYHVKQALEGRQITRQTIATTNSPPSVDRPQPGRQPKPNLRKASGTGDGTSVLVVVGCILAIVYMYPTIIRPLFGIGLSAEEEQEKIKARGIDPDKHRPSNMPAWTSPFGPKSGGN